MILRIILLVLTLVFTIGNISAVTINIQGASTESVLVRKDFLETIISAPLLRSVSSNDLIVEIDMDRKEPRGQMKGKYISLSPYIARDTEFLKLFLHEFAHYVDIYNLRATKKSGDPSDLFYTISWKSKDVKLSGMKSTDFVTGYAATNQYEDFAESFIIYMFHNEQFAELGLKNETLRKKYLFFRDYVFPDGSFEGTDFTVGVIPSYSWDSTKISFSLKKYLYFIR